MNILIVNGYARQNKGDGALMSVLCQQLQQTFPYAVVKIDTQEDPRKRPRFEAWENVGSLRQYCFDPTTSKLIHLLRLVMSCSVVMMLLVLPRKFRKIVLRHLPRPLQTYFSTLVEADLVVSTGGGYLNGGRSAMAQVAVYLMLVPLKLAEHFGVCTVCAPQSMGPFATTFQKRLVTQTLEKADLVLTREAKTVQVLAELSSRFPIIPSVDSGFLFRSDTTISLRKQLHIDPQKLLVGVTVRRWLDPKRQSRYELAIAKTIDHLTSRYGAAVVLIPQVTSSLGGDDDRITNQAVYASVKHKKNVYSLETDYTHHQIKALYNELDLIIGTRFHSVIFSLTSYVPALAIEYEHKTSGIMSDLTLDNWVVKIEEATPDVLIPKVDALIAAKKQYQKHLRSVLPAYIAKAQKATTLIEYAYRYHPEPITE